jgi:hypothetical protein
MDAITVFIKSLPPAWRNSLEKSVKGKWYPSYALRINSSNQLTQQRQEDKPLFDYLTLGVDDVSLMTQIGHTRKDRFRRIKGVGFGQNLQPVWRTRQSQSETMNVFSTQWRNSS